MELVQGSGGEVLPGLYVDCPEEDCVYAVESGALTRFRRGDDLVLESSGVAVDFDSTVAEHERPRFRRIERLLEEGGAVERLASKFVAYVPRDGRREPTGIAAGSGIVGVPVPGADRVLVYYEGGRHGQSEMASLADRVFYAHGRLVESYPTVAMSSLPIDSLVDIGTFDAVSAIVTPTDEAGARALAMWLGASELDPAELRRSSRP